MQYLKICLKQIDTPLVSIDIENPHSHSLMNKSDPLQSILKVQAQISALKSYVKWEIYVLNNKMDSLNERLNHLMHDKTSHSKAFETLQESVTFLQSEPRSKDKIIKTLLESQTAVLDAVSKKRTSSTMGNEENVIVINNDNEILSAVLPSRSLRTPSKENTNLKQHQNQTQESLPPAKPNNDETQYKNKNNCN